MPSFSALLLGLGAITVPVVTGAPVQDASTVGQYAPQQTACPTGPLVREANALSTAETAYLTGRKPLADKALASWLDAVDPDFNTSATMPTIGLAASGGGYRAFLTGAGVVQGLDAQDTSMATGGLWQAVTYHAGLSGGAWLVAALAANEWPTISSQMESLWSDALDGGIVSTAFSLGSHRILGYINDLFQKKKAGYHIEIADPWGLILASQLVYDNLPSFSAIASSSKFANFSVPFPIITATEVDTMQGECYPQSTAPIYEITPYEFGSWDTGLRSFTQTQYLGSKVSAGQASSCVTGFDNVGYLLGTVSNLFNGNCNQTSPIPLPQVVQDMLMQVVGTISRDMNYASYPNPFYQSNVPQTNSNVSAVASLSLADAGETHQNDPLWPLLQPERPVDVIIVNDNGGMGPTGYPDGSEMHNTYVRAQQVGLSKMPEFPDSTTFAPSVQRPWFFGCHSPDQATLIYLPNTNVTVQSNTSTYQLQYSKEESAGMVSNGAAIASQNGDPQWPTCLGCGIMQKTGSRLPDACSDCLKKYCYN